jgi:hypothetical protein
VSNRALVAVSCLAAIYVVARFAVLPHGMQNASGYFAERLEPEQIRARFGAGFSRFNVYTVFASIASVLLSEPRSGESMVMRAWQAGDIPPRIWINVASALLTTILMAITARSLWWRNPAAEPDVSDMRADFIVFAAVLAASAVASFAYAKDEIMSAAGVLYAVAAFWTVRDRLMRARPVAGAVALAVTLLLASSLWAVRVVGVHHVLRTQAFALHNDWASVRDHLPADPDARQLVTTLRAQALSQPVVNPWFVPRWADRVFDIDYF